MAKVRKHLSEPWFSFILTGLKVVEGRLNRGDFAAMKVGDEVIFENNDFKFVHRELRVKITRTVKYESFFKYLENEELAACLPGVPSIDVGLKVYAAYFPDCDINTAKAVAVHFELVSKIFEVRDVSPSP